MGGAWAALSCAAQCVRVILVSGLDRLHRHHPSGGDGVLVAGATGVRKGSIDGHGFAALDLFAGIRSVQSASDDYAANDNTLDQVGKERSVAARSFGEKAGHGHGSATEPRSATRALAARLVGQLPTE